MSRKPNAEFTVESVKHLAFDNVETRALEIAMRAYVGQPVDDADKTFMASVPGTLSTLWFKFKQARVSYEAAEMLAAMRAPVALSAVTSDKPADKPADKKAA